VACDRSHLAEALLLEGGIADREHLVHHEDIGLEMRGHGEREAHVHAAGVVLHLRIDEPLHLGEVHDLVELRCDLGSPHAEDRAAQEDVLPSRQIRMKPRSHLEQRPHSALEIDLSRRRLDDARQDLEQRALAGPVATDDADDLAVRDVERDVVERPELLDGLSLRATAHRSRRATKAIDDRFAQRAMRGTRAQLVLFAEMGDADGGAVPGLGERA